MWVYEIGIGRTVVVIKMKRKLKKENILGKKLMNQFYKIACERQYFRKRRKGHFISVIQESGVKYLIYI